MTVTVSGPLFDEGGNLLADTTCVVVAVEETIGQDGGLRVKRGITVVTNGSGVFSADLKPGKYVLYVSPTANDSTSLTVQRIGDLLVLVGEASMTLEEARSANVQVSPGALVAAEQAAVEAAASAAEADASATSASNSADDAALASASALASATAAGAQIYPTISDGIAAVGVGDVFMVPITPSGGLDVREKTGASTSASIGEILAPTQSPTDTTAGRLMKVGDFGLGTITSPTLDDANATDVPNGLYRITAATANRPFDIGVILVHRNNISRITQTATQVVGADAGVVFVRVHFDGVWGDWRRQTPERGSNANGEYVRYPDGTQMCWIADLTLDYTSNQLMRTAWTFPASFVDSNVVGGLTIDGSASDFTDLFRTNLGAESVSVSSPNFGNFGFIVTNSSAVTTSEIRGVSCWAMGRWF